MADVEYRVVDRHAPNRAASDGIRGVAERTRAEAQAGTPVDTGRLRRGWRVERGRLPGTWVIVNDVPYAAFVEFGSGRNRPPAAMLGRALAAERNRR
jgi:hypothetical protein